MGLLDWWRRRAAVDPTDLDTSAADVRVLAPPTRGAPDELLDTVRRRDEVLAAYLYDTDEGTTVGVLLDEAVDDEELRSLEEELAGRHGLRFELLGAEGLLQAQDVGEELLSRDYDGLP